MKKTLRLSAINLKQLGDRIPIPNYKRSSLKIGIVHIGVGGFHRAHQAYYTHALQEKSFSLDWGICGIGLRKGDQKIYDVLKKQDGLYTLMVKHPNGEMETRIIGSICDFLLGVDDPMSVIARMADSATKIVSLTITEGGYNFNPSTGEFDFENPDIQHELQHLDSPKTVYGFLSASLRKRRDAGLPAFTIMSCDNIQHNGDVTRNMLLAFAKRQDVALAKWIEQ